MQRAATDVMQSILFSAVLDGIAALKRASGGLPNQLLRDVQAIHPNVTFADLPKELQDAARREHARRVHAAAEGRLCGRPAPADAASRGRWTACPSASARAPAIAADRRAARRRATPRRPAAERRRRGTGGGEARAGG